MQGIGSMDVAIHHPFRFVYSIFRLEQHLADAHDISSQRLFRLFFSALFHQFLREDAEEREDHCKDDGNQKHDDGTQSCCK